MIKEELKKECSCGCENVIRIYEGEIKELGLTIILGHKEQGLQIPISLQKKDIIDIIKILTKWVNK